MNKDYENINIDITKTKEEINKEIYEIIKKRKNIKLKKDLFIEYGSVLITFYIMFSSLILGQLLSFMYLFVYDNVTNINIIFGDYTIIIVHGFLSTVISGFLFIIAIIGLSLYHKSQSIYDMEKTK